MDLDKVTVELSVSTGYHYYRLSHGFHYHWLDLRIGNHDLAIYFKDPEVRRKFLQDLAEACLEEAKQ
jgi:hypothetical protein